MYWQAETISVKIHSTRIVKETPTGPWEARVLNRMSLKIGFFFNSLWSNWMALELYIISCTKSLRKKILNLVVPDVWEFFSVSPVVDREQYKLLGKNASEWNIFKRINNGMGFSKGDSCYLRGGDYIMLQCASVYRFRSLISKGYDLFIGIKFCAKKGGNGLKRSLYCIIKIWRCWPGEKSPRLKFKVIYCEGITVRGWKSTWLKGSKKDFICRCLKLNVETGE